MIRARSLHHHFVAVLLLAMLLALAASAASWFIALEQRGAALRESRFQFSIGTLRDALESGLRLGLLLPDLPGAQNLINQSQAQDRVILSIDVFDTEGRVLFSTDDDGTGARIPQFVRAPCLAATDRHWSGRDKDGPWLCTPLKNSYEQVDGGIVLRYALTDRRDAIGMAGGNWKMPLLLFGAVTLLAGAGGWFALRGTEHALRQAETAVREDTPIDPHPLTASLTAALAALRQREEGLRRTDAEADRLDHLDAR